MIRYEPPSKDPYPDNLPARLFSEHYVCHIVHVVRFGRDNWWKYPPQAARQLPRQAAWQVRLFERIEGHNYGTRLGTRKYKTRSEALKQAEVVLTNLEGRRTHEQNQLESRRA